MAELRERIFVRTRLALARALSGCLTGQYYSGISAKLSVFQIYFVGKPV
jgi:hypothetical protein